MVCAYGRVVVDVASVAAEAGAEEGEVGDWDWGERCHFFSFVGRGVGILVGRWRFEI